MATANETEYGQIDDVPLSTPAWLFPTLGDLYGSPDVHVEGTDLAYHHGEEAGEEWGGGRTLVMLGKVFGARDSDGVLHPDRGTGLRRNLDALKALLRPQREPRTFLWHFPVDTDRSAPCQATGPVRAVPAGAGGVWKVTLPLWLPGGVLNNTTAETADGTDSAEFQVVVPNPGTADQYDAAIALSGTATSVTIVSGLGHSLMYSGDLSVGAVSLQTGPMTADRVGTDVHGLVTSSYPRWLPIPAGGDTWTVTPTGGSVTVAVSHKAPWL